MFELPSELPTLIMGGSRDGCIANSSSRYGSASGSATQRVEKTFDQALSSNRADCYLAIIDGANHFSLAWPGDHSTGRPFIDLPTTQPDEALRELLALLICQFTLAVTKQCNQSRRDLENNLLQSHPLILRGDRR